MYERSTAGFVPTDDQVRDERCVITAVEGGTLVRSGKAAIMLGNVNGRVRRD